MVSRIAYQRWVRLALVLSLCIVLFGAGMHIFFSERLYIAKNLGMPMEVKDLAEDKELEIMMLVAGVAVVGYEEDNKAEIRLVWKFPEKLPVGTKFKVINGKIITVSLAPKEVPKISI
ncbi:MAG: hypothetical protein Q8N68_02140 [bacterium]|nr:hypothetical protein [bacterium]